MKKQLVNIRQRTLHVLTIASFCIICALIFTSCIEEEYFAASVDGSKYSIDSESPTIEQEDFGINLGFYLFLGLSKAPHANGLSSILRPPASDGPPVYYAFSGKKAPQPLYSLAWRDEDAMLYFPKSKAPSAFTENLRLFTALEFVQKNGRIDGDKMRCNYLEVPVYGVYQYKLPKVGTFFGGLGPYFAYGIGGKQDVYGGDKIKSFDKTNGFKRGDAGIGFVAGYRMPIGFSAWLSYDAGLVDIDRYAGSKTHNRSFGLNIGYSVEALHKAKKKH